VLKRSVSKLGVVAMKITSVLRVSVALTATALIAALVVNLSNGPLAGAQEATATPGGEVQYGNPPPPQCGPGENGVTKDGRACSGGPIIVPQQPVQTDEERQQEREQLGAFWKAHPDAWKARNWPHDVCTVNPQACANIGGGGPVAPAGRVDADTIDPDTHDMYRVDPDTGAIIQKITPLPGAVPTSQATPSSDPQSSKGLIEV
jgi:hypothetical protein